MLNLRFFLMLDVNQASGIYCRFLTYMNPTHFFNFLVMPNNRVTSSNYIL